MKPFDLEKAKVGEPVCTRSGLPARILTFDVRSHYPIVGVIGDPDFPGNEIIETYTTEGLCIINKMNDKDLMMASKKKQGWIGIMRRLTDTDSYLAYTTNVYATKKGVENELSDIFAGRQLIEIKQIEWEE